VGVISPPVSFELTVTRIKEIVKSKKDLFVGVT